MMPLNDLVARFRAINRRAIALQVANALLWGCIIAGFAWGRR